MNRKLSFAAILFGLVILSLADTSSRSASAQSSADGKLRIIAFGAHPDDPEIGVSGTASLWAAKGHHVKLVAVTNGDIGHWKESGGELARRRKVEVERAAKLHGYTVEVLDNHDGELLPTLENRKKLTKLIREWNADIVISHRPNDYHPDHRYTGVLVQDAAYMVTVPNFCPDVPILKSNPVFLYYSDRFEKPNPFQADIIVDIGPVMEKKLDGLLGMVSQFYEGGANGSEELMNKDPNFVKARWQTVRDRFVSRQRDVANKYRKSLEEWYGKERAAKVEYAEAFEICEYGRRPNKAEIRKLFPFFD
ncbi:MAG TPA: PIG-L family deacetylase [Blastocatellia bacterium]|nr:PIG-L family deacetylase [Blastocatellia bacterium]